MIQEISDFMDVFPAGLKEVGVKPKDGVHVLLRMQRDENGRVFMDANSVVKVCSTKKATEFDYPFLQRCANYARYAWCVNTNKCFDLSAKGIHSASPYCVALKKESLEGGSKYVKDKVKIYNRINYYFETALSFVDDVSERERLKVFQYFINSRERLDRLFALFSEEFVSLGDKEYVVLYLDEDVEKYKVVNEKYLADKLFNTNNYNVVSGEEVFGTSDFLNGFSIKKPFLSHQSATFDIAGRISGKVARDLYEFQECLRRDVLPRPLPMFVYQEELIESFVIISQEVEVGG